MPGWHERIAELREQGLITEVGLIEEQHPDRCRLFMQWKQMDFPVMVDALNLLGVSAVPITLLIDEEGVVEEIVGRRNAESVEAFARRPSTPPGLESPVSGPPDLDALKRSATDTPGAMAYADALVMWGGDLDEAIDLYQQALASNPSFGDAAFRLGVAYRRRYESDQRVDGDFASAIEAWRLARSIDPNQYIWRRRIQQYGPRLDKPYSFYDWVHEARQDITARGQTPVPLSVEPRGAELADRSRDPIQTPDATEPDADARITSDEGLIRFDSAIVPHTDGEPVWRLHLLFTPSGDAHWNNEAEPMQVWIDVPDGWSANHRLVEIPNAPDATSDEIRSVEIELRPNGAERIQGVTFRGHALYNVCEGADGVCLYRRLDFGVKNGP